MFAVISRRNAARGLVVLEPPDDSSDNSCADGSCGGADGAEKGCPGESA
jgi:hypothetical protein